MTFENYKLGKGILETNSHHSKKNITEIYNKIDWRIRFEHKPFTGLLLIWCFAIFKNEITFTNILYRLKKINI